jgi:hypothetical protein
MNATDMSLQRQQIGVIVRDDDARKRFVKEYGKVGIIMYVSLIQDQVWFVLKLMYVMKDTLRKQGIRI